MIDPEIRIIKKDVGSDSYLEVIAGDPLIFI